MYRYYLDGTLVDEAQGWDEFYTTIKRDAALKGLLTVNDITLTFRGSGYTYLKDTFDTLGHCQEVTCRIEKYDAGQWTYFYEGIIFLSDVEWTEFNKQAKTKVTDNSFNARIYNNRDIGIVLTTEVAKDLTTAITPVTVRECDLFNPTSPGAPAGVPCLVIPVEEALTTQVRWMSNGEVDFTSDYFGTHSDTNNLVITSGYAIRKAFNSETVTQAEYAQNLPTISFQKLFTSLDKLYNLRFSIDTTVSPAMMRVEPESYFRGTSNLATLSDVDEVRTKTAVEKLFSKVKFGSAETLNASSVEFPESIRFVGFNKEEYYVTGQCNIDNTLDLENELIYSSNVIESLYDNPSDLSYDGDLFLIEVDRNGTYGASYYEATDTNWLGSITTAKFYNEGLTNASVAQRYLGGVPSSIAQSLTVQDDSFQAHSSQMQGGSGAAAYTIVPFPCDIENSDAGNNYDNTTYEYTAPDNGVFAFSIYLPIYYTNLYPSNGVAIGTGTVEAYLDVYDAGGYSGGTLLYSRTAYNQTNLNTLWDTYDITTAYSLNLNAGEKVVLRVVLTGYQAGALHVGTVIRVNALASFACTSSSTGGGEYQEYDPEEYPVLIHEMKYALTGVQFDAIKADTTGLVTFAVNGEQPKQGWIETLKMNNKTEIADIKLISSKRLNN